MHDHGKCERCDQQERELAGLREAAIALAARLDAMTAPLNDVCPISHIHGLPYVGPTWTDELAMLRAALAAVGRPDTTPTKDSPPHV